MCVLLSSNDAPDYWCLIGIKSSWLQDRTKKATGKPVAFIFFDWFCD